MTDVPASVIYACGSPWGIGVYTIEGESIYGYPPRAMNPHDFSPDPECCLPDEIKAWENACIAWDEARVAVRTEGDLK